MIYFVRHGQTDYNLNKLRTGQRDIPLNDMGIEQAKNTAEKLKDIKFDKCFCSTLIRAKQTLNEILKYHSEIEPIFDDRLIECGFGELEGTPFNNDEINDRKFGKDNELAKKYNMESLENVYKRVSSFYDENCLKNTNQNILIVSHGGIAMVSSVYFKGIPEDGDLSRFIIKNANYVTF